MRPSIGNFHLKQLHLDDASFEFGDVLQKNTPGHMVCGYCMHTMERIGIQRYKCPKCGMIIFNN